MGGRVRIQHHRSPYGDWDHFLGAPDPRLDDCITEYHGYVERVANFTARREVPNGLIPLIFNFGPGFAVAGQGSTTHFAASFIAGIDDGYSDVAALGPADCLQVNLTPLGAFRLFGLPMEAMARRVLDLSDLIGSHARRFTAQLAETPGWAARFGLLDAFFLQRLAEARRETAAVAWAFAQLKAQPGRLRIGDLAGEIGWSRKHLVTRFRAEVGLAPKTLDRVLRFERMLRLLERGGAPLAGLALDGGYFDQAHMIRDFRDFAGCTPRAYLARLIPDGGGLLAG